MKRACFLLVIGLAMGYPQTAWSQEENSEQQSEQQNDQSASGQESYTVTLPVIEVRGQVRREELESTSATLLDNADIIDRIYASPLDILKLSPGVSITQYGESGLGAQVRMRGFTGGHSSDVAMFLDGIPLNDGGHTDGYVDTNLINPIEIESVEIIKGPASVYYGNHSSGGVAAFQSYKTGDFTRLRVNYGSYNALDTSGILANQGEKLAQVYAFQVYHTDGWRDNSEWEKQNVSARWTYEFTEKFSASLNLRGFHSEWDSPGYIPSFQSPSSAVDDGSGQGNGGKRKRFDGRIWANYQLDDSSQFTFYSFMTYLDNTRYRTEYRPVFGTVSGQEQTNHRDANGTGVAYNYKGQWAGRDASLSLGIDYLREEEARDQWNLRWGSGRTRFEHYTDYKYTLDTVALFWEVIYQILDPLQVRIGARYDMVSGEMDTGADQNDSSVSYLQANSHYKGKDRKVFSPKAGLLYTVTPWLDVFANYGHGFGLPGMTNGRFFTDDGSEVTKRDQYEGGFRIRPSDWAEFGITYYRLYTSNDETYDAITDVWENAGKTLRTGVETTLDLNFWDDWSFHADYAYQTAKYRSYQSASYIYDGRRLNLMPRHITNLELAYKPECGLGGRITYHWEADFMINDDPSVNYRTGATNNNQTRGQDYGSLDLQLTYQFDEKYKLTVDVLNVLDKDYYGNRGIVGNSCDIFPQST